MNLMSEWNFCRALTDTLRFAKSRFLQNAEFWPGEQTGLPKQQINLVTSTGDGGAGFDVMQHDGLRQAVRSHLPPIFSPIVMRHSPGLGFRA